MALLMALLPGPSETLLYRSESTPISITDSATGRADAVPESRGTSAADSGQVFDEPPEEWEIPKPNVTEMQDEVRQRLINARADVVSQPRSSQAWGSFGMVLDAHKLQDAAETCYRRALALDPKQALYRYLLAIVLDAQGRSPEELIALYEGASELVPKYPQISWRLGDALVRQGRYEDAREAFLKAIEIDPELAMAHRSLGEVLLALSDPEGALTHLERAVELTPADGGIHQALARAYMAIGDRERADEAAEKSRTYEHQYRLPDPIVDEISALAVSSSTAYRRAKSLITAGDFAGAVPDLVIVEKARPDDPIVKIFLAEAYRRTGRFAEAELLLSDALSLKPDAVSAYMEYGRIRYAQGQTDEAIEFFREALDLMPDHPTINVELGLALVKKGDFPEAIAAFECASDKREIAANVHVNWGYALRRSGSISESIPHFRQAIELAPEYADAHAQLAVALMESGENEEAAVHMRRAAEIDPGHPIAGRMAPAKP
jgi:tetratricopeptide (TPR) repeat protein